MNCVFVFETLNLGGAERQGLLLARHLKVNGGAVSVLALTSSGPAIELCERYGLPWQVIGADEGTGLRDWLSCLRLIRALRQIRPDLIMSYTTPPNVLCGRIWRWTGARACIWNQRDEGRHLLSANRVQARAIRRVSRVISNSRHAADFLSQTFGLERSAIRVVQNGVELAPPQRSRDAWRQELGLRDGDLAVCMPANLHPHKDHRTLIQAWRQVVNAIDASDKKAILVLAGAFVSTAEMLQALATELGLKDRVRFLGQVRDMPGLLQAMDLGVFSSKHEGVPNGVLECMAAGLAVAATDIHGIREALGEANQPWLSPPDNADGLASRVLALLNDPGLRQSVGAHNRQRAQTEFSPERMTRDMVALMREVLGMEGLKN